MRLLSVLLIAALITVAYAWTKEDHEIFDLVSALEASEGRGTTFYSWLGVSSTASTNEISKAYRKKSVQLHPDKNPGVKDAHERFARLGVIAKMLRDSEGRERYDFFYKNGVPKWRGTGYYYSRFRPGLGTVLTFLILLTSALHYVIQSLNFKRDVLRIEEIRTQARAMAWGSKMIPTSEGKRKVKLNLGGGPRLDDDGNVVSGRLVDMVVEGNDVYHPQPDGSLTLIDSSNAEPPALKRTWFLALIIMLFDKMTKRASHVTEDEDVSANGDLEDSDTAPGTSSDARGGGDATSKGPPRPGTKGGRVAATTMAGGRRRKVVRKR